MNRLHNGIRYQGNYYTSSPLKNSLRAFLSSILRKTKRLVKRTLGILMRPFEKDPIIIMWIDGGFCSQIFRYLKGRWFAVRGFNVKYDISWYDNNPVDCLHTEHRDFLLLKCFPDVDFEVASHDELQRYRRLYSTNIHNTAKKYHGHYEELKAPLYNYWYDLDDIIATEKEFRELAQYLHWEKLHDILGTEARKIEQSIIRDKQSGLKVIGLHVRRGDMAVKKFAHGGKVLTSKYYEHVLNMAVDENSVVYIFSNGYDFVASDVVPYVKCRYILADKTSEVYEDIYLCSLCNVQIAGQGGLANMAYSFNANDDRKLIRPFLRENDEERLPRYYAGSSGTVEFVRLTEDMYEH